VDFIDGRNSRDALDIIDRFGSKEGFAVLALNPRAAGVGLTITAANHVFHYNPEWNPALMAQATARVHRIGQENEVVAHWMYCTGETIDTIEEEMMDKLGFKRQLFEGAIRGIQADSEDEESFILSLLNLEEER
jgi:SNF2 family DNA or RNA helicase